MSVCRLAARGCFSEGISAADMAELRWVKPRLVVEVAFVEWTDYRLLRSGHSMPIVNPPVHFCQLVESVVRFWLSHFPKCSR